MTSETLEGGPAPLVPTTEPKVGSPPVSKSPAPAERGEASASPIYRVVRRIPLVLGVAAIVDVGVAWMLAGSQSILVLKDIPHATLLVAVALVFLTWPLRILRLRRWARVFDESLDGRSALGVTTASEASAAVLPTSVAGIPALAFLLHHSGVRLRSAISITAAVAVEDLAASLCLFAGTLALWPAVRANCVSALTEWAPSWTGSGDVLVAIGVVFLLVAAGFWWDTRRRPTAQTTRRGLRFQRALRRRVASLESMMHEGTRSLRRARFKVGLTFAFALAQWLARYSIIAVLAGGMGTEASKPALFALQFLVFAAMGAVPTPGATGGAELSFLLLHRGVVADSALPALMIGWRALTFAVPVALAGVITVVWQRQRDRHRADKAAPGTTVAVRT